MANQAGTRWRGKLTIPKHAHPLVRQFFRELNAQKTTLSEVAERAPFRRATISDWRYRRDPTLSNFEAALNVIGLELAIRPQNGKRGWRARTAMGDAA